MKITRLINNFAMCPEITDPYDSVEGAPFRHFCDKPRHDYQGSKEGWPLYKAEFTAGKCDYCSEPIPPKVMFMYKLWYFHNSVIS